MTKRSIIQSLAATAVVGILGVGILVPAIAQESGDDTTTAGETSDRGAAREERKAEFAAALAEELGLDAETVATAIETVREELRAAREAEHRGELEENLAAAVTAGDITQEQSDALLAAFDADLWPFDGRGHSRHHGPGGRGGPGSGGPGA